MIRITTYLDYFFHCNNFILCKKFYARTQNVCLKTVLNLFVEDVSLYAFHLARFQLCVQTILFYLFPVEMFPPNVAAQGS